MGVELMEEVIKESVQEAAAHEFKYVPHTVCYTLLKDEFQRVRVCQRVVASCLVFSEVIFIELL